MADDDLAYTGVIVVGRGHSASAGEMVVPYITTSDSDDRDTLQRAADGFWDLIRRGE